MLRILEGRWHASWDPLDSAAEHSIICGGVDASAFLRRSPIEIVDGSTSPSQEEKEAVVAVGHEVVGGWAVGYDTRRRCQMARVIVATWCSGLKGDGGRQEGMTAVSENKRVER